MLKTRIMTHWYHLQKTKTAAALTWGNADDYDICLDTVRLGVEETASLIEQYVTGKIKRADGRFMPF